jgi:hypothetical protein
VRVRSLGFRPPTLALDAELEWILQRAFGPPAWMPKADVAGQKLVETALRLDVATRIAARQPRELLERELGSDAAHRLREQHFGAIARELMLERALERLLHHSEALGAPCILLKYAALRRMGVLRLGARLAGDLDVLVPQAKVHAFQALLLRNGYRDAGLPESHHQLPALQDPDGVWIEVHVHIPAVTLMPGGPFATADALIAASLTHSSGNALLAAPAIVAAHALAHGLAQHARAPHMYSPLKVFADLADLEAANEGALEGATAFLSAAMSREESTSARELTRALQRGDLEVAMNGGSGVLLRHALASQLDRRYAVRLRLRMLTQRGPTPLHFDRRRILLGLRRAWEMARSWTLSLRERD